MQAPIISNELNDLIATLPKDQQRAFQMLQSWSIKKAVNANFAEVEKYLAKLMKGINGKVPVLNGLHNFTIQSKGFAGRAQITMVKVTAIVTIEQDGNTISFPRLWDKCVKVDKGETLKKIIAHPIGLTLCAFMAQRKRFSGHATELVHDLAVFDSSFDGVTYNAVRVGKFLSFYSDELRAVFNVIKKDWSGKTRWTIADKPAPVEDCDF